MPAREKQGKWAKGQSGNPAGRRKEDGDIRELARSATPKCLNRLIELVDSENERVAVAAAQYLLDRAWGRPAQAVTGENGEGPIRHRFTIEIVDPKDPCS